MNVETFKRLYAQYRDVISYLFFGVCTTLVNMFAYWLGAYPFGWNVPVSTVFAWTAGVLFAYLTNRRWVFHSDAKTSREILREIASFVSCRLATGLLDLGCMFFFVDVLQWNQIAFVLRAAGKEFAVGQDMIVKALDNVLVVILNYVGSKLLVFRKSGDSHILTNGDANE